MSNALIYKPLEETRTEQGIQWSIGYYCKDQSELDSVNQEVGDISKWTPSYAKIREARKTSLLDDTDFPCYLDLTASPRDANNTQNNDDFSTKVLQKWNLAEFTFNQDHFGVRKAEKEDVDNKIKDIAGNSCVKGAWLFSNATKDNKGGQSNYSAPFTWSASWENILNALSGIPHKCRVCEVSYYTKESPEQATNSTAYRPSGNGFKLDSQEIEEVADRNGAVWTKVVKRYIEVPIPAMQWKQQA